MNPVPATRLASEEEMWDNPPDGSYILTPESKYFLCVCPCSCSGVMNLPIYQSGDPKPAPNAWLWNGSIDKPSLQPSIRDLSGCRFHGYITDGVWTFQGDSGVK